jgi:hypothetical protein
MCDPIYATITPAAPPIKLNNTLGENLAHDPPVPRSQRHAHRHICAPHCAARQQQVRYVGACRKQHHAGENHEHAQTRPGLLLQPLNAATGRRKNHVLSGDLCRAAMLGISGPRIHPLPQSSRKFRLQGDRVDPRTDSAQCVKPV